MINPYITLHKSKATFKGEEKLPRPPGQPDNRYVWPHTPEHSSYLHVGSDVMLEQKQKLLVSPFSKLQGVNVFVLCHFQWEITLKMT